MHKYTSLAMKFKKCKQTLKFWAKPTANLTCWSAQSRIIQSFESEREKRQMGFSESDRWVFGTNSLFKKMSKGLWPWRKWKLQSEVWDLANRRKEGTAGTEPPSHYLLSLLGVFRSINTLKAKRDSDIWGRRRGEGKWSCVCFRIFFFWGIIIFFWSSFFWGNIKLLLPLSFFFLGKKS